MAKIKLDPEEQEILDSFERDEWQSAPDLQKVIAEHRQYARNTMKKDARVNVRLSSTDLNDLKVIALEHGIPYQTLISSILHKYVSGHLIEKPVSDQSR